MSEPIKIVSINISAERGTLKSPVAEARIDGRGIVGDAHAGAWHRQVSLLGQASVERFAAQAGRSFAPGEFAENLLLRGLDLNNVALLDLLRIGEVSLQVTQIGKACHARGCEVYRQTGDCVMPKEGLFCRVLQGGRIRSGDSVEYLPQPFGARIITLSDRASRGEYEDRSGPRIKELLLAHFAGSRWHLQIDNVLLPDEAELLRAELAKARADGVRAVFTTGGTGVGPRDITPETVTACCDRFIPGIMEQIRAKFGAENPLALLSRSVAGVAGQTLVYALPGSRRAIEEYLGEIMKTLEHLVLMLQGLDIHDH